ncbi:glycosyltransferase [Granulicatella sp. zg-ZJ]|uniref:glycosyltransferase family 2 protein n=1 Tax=unclassified Granulicatella TaxID=2630493 RepID=UPI0013C1DE26|nr:glycosyltransferase family 2 protein [Carnobacteriaceae bacterium zg-ZUI78]NEW62758.1 glycosyltransferase [Granulicatella sp. zg-ZJ]NEW65542.1 glycosyltransferase [Granulicatella sp. zg-84]QMI86691.1 glycosyltransferase family 2 protein [Carnobacteriaceae bacterium zg-84]
MVVENPILYIVIPCYNEEAVLPHTFPLFSQQLHYLMDNGYVSPLSRILFVDDGSKDKTWDLIRRYSQEEWVEGISQNRNRGHQSTVLAGMIEAADFADIVITIDCDGQDDICCMTDMVQAYKNGAEIVYGVRKDRSTDTFFKRFTAEKFYKLLSKMGGEVIYNHADYRLMSKKAILALSEFKEVNIYLRGLVPLIGFNHAVVEYSRKERMAGESHYPLSKMLGLAFDGITSLSVRPIRVITVLGVLTSIISFIFLIWSIVSYFFGYTLVGWTSMISIMSFLGGIQLISIGIIGEYIGKIYLETKARPRYMIDRKTKGMRKESCEK